MDTNSAQVAAAVAAAQAAATAAQFAPAGFAQAQSVGAAVADSTVIAAAAQAAAQAAVAQQAAQAAAQAAQVVQAAQGTAQAAPSDPPAAPVPAPAPAPKGRKKKGMDDADAVGGNVPEPDVPLAKTRPKRASADATKRKIEATLHAEEAGVNEILPPPPPPAAKKRPKASHRLKLTYLDIKGLAEPIRLALTLGGLEFEDERISHEEVARRRDAGLLPQGQVPVLEIDGVTHAQSMALLRWAGKKAGLLPEAQAILIDEVHEAMAEIHTCLRPLWYGHILGRSPTSGAMLVSMTDDQKDEVTMWLNEEVVPARLQRLEQMLGASDYFCGGTLTTCDLQWYVMGSGLLDGTYCEGLEPAVLDGCPKLKQLIERVGELPKVAEWNAHKA
jgi:glutathione S-transferase